MPVSPSESQYYRVPAPPPCRPPVTAGSRVTATRPGRTACGPGGQVLPRSDSVPLLATRDTHGAAGVTRRTTCPARRPGLGPDSIASDLGRAAGPGIRGR
eukprot:753753-Hanusia_phi.AAC.2